MYSLIVYSKSNYLSIRIYFLKKILKNFIRRILLKKTLEEYLKISIKNIF